MYLLGKIETIDEFNRVAVGLKNEIDDLIEDFAQQTPGHQGNKGKIVSEHGMKVSYVRMNLTLVALALFAATVSKTEDRGTVNELYQRVCLLNMALARVEKHIELGLER